MTQKKIKVRFVRNSRQGEDMEIHAEGTELEMPEASAARWIRRGAVVEVPPEPAPKQKTSTAKKVKDNG